MRSNLKRYMASLNCTYLWNGIQLFQSMISLDFVYQMTSFTATHDISWNLAADTQCNFTKNIMHNWDVTWYHSITDNSTVCWRVCFGQEKSKPATGHLWRESTGDRWIPLHRWSVEFPITMPWRHHANWYCKNCPRSTAGITHNADCIVDIIQNEQVKIMSENGHQRAMSQAISY